MSRYWSMPTSIVATRHRHRKIQPPADPRSSWWHECRCAGSAALYREGRLATRPRPLRPLFGSSLSGSGGEQLWHCRMPSATESSTAPDRRRISWSRILRVATAVRWPPLGHKAKLAAGARSYGDEPAPPHGPTRSWWQAA